MRRPVINTKMLSILFNELNAVLKLNPPININGSKKEFSEALFTATLLVRDGELTPASELILDYLYCGEILEDEARLFEAWEKKYEKQVELLEKIGTN
jgi:hypothetical protein